MLPQKRSQPDSGRGLPRLSEIELKVYQLITSKENAGIWTRDVKKAMLGVSPQKVGKVINSLEAKNLIKDVPSVKHTTKKIVMGVEFEPLDEMSGGTWYQEGSLDIAFIKILRQQCMKQIRNLKVATCEMIWEGIRALPVFTTDITLQQVSDIVELMDLDKEIEKVRSTGVRDFSHVPAGRECYRILKGIEGPQKGWAFSSIPCGVCPRISECMPDGVISPLNCIYYNKWLDVDF